MMIDVWKFIWWSSERAAVPMFISKDITALDLDNTDYVYVLIITSYSYVEEL